MVQNLEFCIDSSRYHQIDSCADLEENASTLPVGGVLTAENEHPEVLSIHITAARNNLSEIDVQCACNFTRRELFWQEKDSNSSHDLSIGNILFRASRE